jgi:hypothetical protein
MSRTEIKVDSKLLQDVIKKCEGAKTYSSHSALFTDVANSYNSERGILPEVSSQLVGLRVKGLSIPLITQKGKKGRAKGFRPTGIKVPRADKLAANPDTRSVLDGIRKEIINTVKSQSDGKGDPTRFLNIVDKMEAGSITAAVKINCLLCSNLQPVEIKNCQCGPGAAVPCGMWLIRPYQNQTENE